MAAGNVAHNNSILVVSGGTAGHILPSVQIVAALLEQGASVAWVGDLKAIQAMPAWPKVSTGLLQAKSPRSWRRLLTIDFYKHLFSDIKLIWQLLSTRSYSGVLVTGGVVGVIPGIIALLRNIPVFVYEQNVILGVANKLIARLGARQVFFGLPPLEEKNGLYVAQPLRPEILKLKRTPKRTPLKKVLLIIGGSLGAASFNTKLVEALGEIKGLSSWAIIHLAGPTADCEAIQARYGAHPDCTVLAYCQEIAGLYARADCVIARSGALTLSELDYLKHPVITIPLPNSAGDHQKANAKALSKVAPMILLDESKLKASTLEEMIYTSLMLAQDIKTQSESPYQHSAKEIAQQCLRLSQHP